MYGAAINRRAQRGGTRPWTARGRQGSRTSSPRARPSARSTARPGASTTVATRSASSPAWSVSRRSRTSCGLASCPRPPRPRPSRARCRGAEVPAPVLALLRSLPRDMHPLDALRTAVSLAAAVRTPGASDERGERAEGVPADDLVPAAVAAWHRIRRDASRWPPGPEGSHAAHVLGSSGRRAGARGGAVMDVALALHADHEFNASTFAARVAVATLADLHAAVVAAIATLKGPRHGGANEDVLLMLAEIGDPARAEAFVEARLAPAPGSRARSAATPRAHARLRPPRVQGRRRAGPRAAGHGPRGGPGHRPHPAPRSPSGSTPRCGPGRPAGDVDFFSAVVYDALGIPPDLCTSIFATGAWPAGALRPRAVRGQPPDPPACPLRGPCPPVPRR